MAYQSEIEKLEQRYEENPKQWFAALADAYRKEGSLDLALDYVRGGLEMRPNYASGYIVLGRCLVEKGHYAEAAEAFEQVLQLDAENIIALKSLGEIAELQSDFVGAKSWLQRLLEVDPMNEDARESLERVTQAAAAPPPQPVAAREEPSVAAEEIASAPEARPTAEPGAAWAAEALGRPLESAPPVEPADERVEPVGLEAPPAEEEPFRIEQFETEQPFGVGATAGDAGIERFDIDKDEDRDLGQGPATPIESVELEEPPVAAFGDVQDMEREPIEVEHLDVGTFDDELAWGTGDQLSHEISAEDVGEAVEQREDLAPAVEFMEPAHEEGESETAEEPVDFGALQAIPVIDEDMLAERAVEEPPPPAEEEVLGAEEEEGWAAEAVPAMPVDTVAPEIPDEYRMEELVEETVEEPVPAAELELPEGVLPDEAAPEVEGFEPEADLPLIMPDEEEAPAEAEPQPVVTETMAEVYAQQGLLPEARDTYERLLQRRPDDPVLKARLAELEARARSAAGKQHASRYLALETGGPGAVAFLQQVFAGEAVEDLAPPEVPTEPVSVLDDSESATSPLQSAFGAETEEEDAAEAPGSPTVPAPDEVSLSSVFGEPVVPNAPAEPGGTPGPAPPLPGGVSFDEFYGQAKGEVPEDAEEAPPPRASGGEVSDDEFKDWLEGLKS